MEEEGSIVVDNLVCPRLNKAKMICTSNSCQDNSLICHIETCEYCSSKHEECECFKIERIIKKLLAKKKKISPEIENTLKAMEKVYDEAIDRLSRDKEYLTRLAKDFGYFQEEIEFLSLINDGNHGMINGKVTSKMMETLNLNMNIEITEDDVEKFWKKRKIAFNDLFNKFQDLTNKSVSKFESQLTDDFDLIE